MAEVGCLVLTYVSTIWDVDFTDNPPTLPLHGHHMKRQLIALIQPRRHDLRRGQVSSEEKDFITSPTHPHMPPTQFSHSPPPPPPPSPSPHTLSHSSPPRGLVRCPLSHTPYCHTPAPTALPPPAPLWPHPPPDTQARITTVLG